MAKILLIETATESCSVGVSVDGTVRSLVEDPSVNQHAERLTIFIEEAMRLAGLALPDLDAVTVSRGPGSYTALRVGASVAKGICYALGKPLIAVDTLLALAAAGLEAWRASSPGDRRVPFLMPMIDARRQEVWTAVYSASLELLTPAQPLILENNLFETFISPTLKGERPGVLILAGNGARKAKNVPLPEPTVFSQIEVCSASFLALFAERNFYASEFQDVAYFEPFYMKPPNITTPRGGLF
jgi:tRNA threonylcarbamoyladenosine biosynthesis protein TsaB